MQFREIKVDDAVGWSLAHSVYAGPKKLAKGLLLSSKEITLLQQNHIESVYGYKLSPDDITENDAATAIASHVLGSHLEIGVATRGRCNLHASADGLLLAPSTLDAVNSADEALTLATLPHLSPVTKGQLVGTAKVIPYGVKRTSIEAIQAVEARLSLAPFRPFKASLIVSGPQLPDKTYRLTEGRLSALGGHIQDHLSCEHSITPIKSQLRQVSESESDIILMLGVSAISDRRDVIPAALKSAGGEIISLGMPVDPGNLLLLGSIGNKMVIGLPGCARSPALNGLDWVLERFAARLPLDRDVVSRMGIGGLLKETPNRPEPRAPHSTPGVEITPVVLAAGRSTRAGKVNKLLSPLNGHTVVRQTVANIIDSQFGEAIIVLGHQGKNIEEALSGLRARFVTNADFASGMASSLRLALESLPGECELACICLADMPFIRKTTFKALAQAANRLSEYKIFIPTFNGKRGHPVLWHQDMFPQLLKIGGDKGGRGIIHQLEHLVCEVPVDDPGILIDLDTPEALAQFGANHEPKS